MKNIFALNVNQNNKQSVSDGECFVIDRIGAKEENLIEENLQLFVNMSKKYTLPRFLQIIMFIINMLTLIFVASLVRVLFDISLKTAYNNAPYIFYISIFSVFASIIFLMITKKKKKQLNECPEMQTLKAQYQMIFDNAKRAFSIPEDAKKIDVLTYSYKKKDNKIKIKNYGIFKYINIEMYVYIKYNMIFFADVSELISIPLGSLAYLKIAKKRVNLPHWNKEETFNSKKYKKYKIRANQYGFFIKYFSIKINDPKGEFEILIPNYDIEEFASLLGVKVEKIR